MFVVVLVGVNRTQISADAFQHHLPHLPSSRRHFNTLQNTRSWDVNAGVSLKSKQNDDTSPTLKDEEEPDSNEQLDTIRVRIWRELADGKELSLSQLANAVGERRLGDLRSHLAHVEKQAKTIRNKSDDWRIRRGLSPIVGENGKTGARRKMKLKFRKGKKNETFVRMV